MLIHTINLPGGYYFAAKHIGELRLKDIVSLNTQLFGPRLSPSKVYGLLKTWAGSPFLAYYWSACGPREHSVFSHLRDHEFSLSPTLRKQASSHRG